MNNVFEFGRFGKYFVYDLRNAGNRFGWSMLVLALMPFVVFVFSELFALMFNGHFAVMPDAIRYVAVYIGLFVAVLMAPAKIWGRVTDRRYGSDYLMLPASAFEKWLSMMLICIVVLPLCLSVLILAGDTLSTLVFGRTYADEFMVSELCSLKDLDLADGLDLDFFGLGYVTWLCNILVFALGALCFRRAKTAKTLLVCLLVSIAFGLISALVLGQASFTTEDFEFLFGSPTDPEQVLSRLNLMFNIIFFLIVAGLMTASFFRIKTIKH